MFAYDIPMVNAPRWINALLVAEEWGCPPWEVLPGYANRRWWLAARNFVARERIRAIKDKSKRGNK